MRAESAQNGLHLAAQVGAYPHSALVQFAQERFGNRSAQEHVHMQLCNASRHRFRWRRGKNEFLPRYFLASPPGDQKETRRGVEHR